MNIAANAMGRGAQATLVLGFLAFPMSVALANVALLLTLLLWLGSLTGPLARACFAQALRNPLAAPAVALFAWVLIAASWTPGSHSEVLSFWQKYLKFALVPMVIALLQEPTTRRRCWQAFALALLFTLAVTWLSTVVNIPWTKASRTGASVDHTVFKDHISQGLMMSIFASLCAWFAVTEHRRPWRVAAVVLWLLATGSILLLSQGRTGYLAWAASSLVFAIALAMAHSRRAVLAALAGLAAVVVLAFAVSPVLQDRVTMAWEEARSVRLDSRADAHVSSAGARVEMARLVLQQAAQAPLLGHGTASYPTLAREHFTSTAWCAVVCPHPHNQFLFFLVEQGAVGLLLFLAFLFAMAREAWRHDPPRRALACAFIATAAAASATHSAFWLSTESHCLILMSALIMASLVSRRTRQGRP